MLERLGESHYVLIPREAADALDGRRRPGRRVSGDAGLQVRLVGDEMVVWRSMRTARRRPPASHRLDAAGGVDAPSSHRASRHCALPARTSARR
jgi:hypothetical protein